MLIRVGMLIEALVEIAHRVFPIVEPHFREHLFVVVRTVHVEKYARVAVHFVSNVTVRYPVVLFVPACSSVTDDRVTFGEENRLNRSR